MNYYNEIKTKLIDNEIYQRVKDYSKERHKVLTYFEIGKLLYEAGKKYGESIVKKYSEKLIIEVGKKYDERTLRSMRQFYVVFSDDFWKPVVSKLTWTNSLLIMPLKDKYKMRYYIDLCITQNLTKRQLQEKIKSKEYERLDDKTKEKLIKREEVIVSDFIKNPIIIKNPNSLEVISEKTLQKLILEDIEYFMSELSTDFSFIGSEYKIKIGSRYNYIDILLFNIKYNCYCVVELKVTELKKEHIGQLEFYMNYIDENIKNIYQDKTIGIIIVRENNSYVIKYCSDSRIYSTTYSIK